MAFWNRKDKDVAPTVEQTPALPPTPEPVQVMAPEPANVSVFAPLESPVETEEKRGWLARLSGGLAKSSAQLTRGLGDLVVKRRLDQEMLDQLEENLLAADLGPKTAAKILDEFSRDRFGRDIGEDEVRAALATGIADILRPVARPLDIARPADELGGGPLVVLVCGVNGVGKTTTIGKIAYDLTRHQHKRVLLAAGDTFRAAAREQLGIWAGRASATLFAKADGADSAAVAYEAYEKGGRRRRRHPADRYGRAAAQQGES